MLTSNIAVARNADGRLEVFARGTDNALWHKWQVAPNSALLGLGVPRRRADSDIAVGSNADGRLEVFVRGTDNACGTSGRSRPTALVGLGSQGGVLDLDIAVGRSAAGGWRRSCAAPTTRCGTSGRSRRTAPSRAGCRKAAWITSNIAVRPNADGRLEVFARGTDNALWHKWQVRVFAAVRQAVTRGIETSPRQMPSDHVDMELESELLATQVEFDMSSEQSTQPQASDRAGYMPKGEMRSAGNAGMPKGEMRSNRRPATAGLGMPKGEMRSNVRSGMPTGEMRPKGKAGIRAKSRTCRAHKGRARRVLCQRHIGDQRVVQSGGG